MTRSVGLTIGTNLKMNQTPGETARFIRELAASLPAAGAHYFVIPPFTNLAAALAARDEAGAQLWIGAQNMHWEAAGAFTGEIAVGMLQGLGVDLVLLGHAERRGLFNETDDIIQRKVAAALTTPLRVLLCVGETAADRAANASLETVGRQLKLALAGQAPDVAARLLIAYEPVWSIGAGGTPARPEDIAPAASHLRRELTALFGDAGASIPLLYGGSVDAANAATFVGVPGISGLFVGRAAWTAPGFAAIAASIVPGA